MHPRVLAQVLATFAKFELDKFAVEWPLLSFFSNNVIDLYFSIKYNNTNNKDAVFNDFFIILFFIISLLTSNFTNDKFHRVELLTFKKH